MKGKLHLNRINFRGLMLKSLCLIIPKRKNVVNQVEKRLSGTYNMHLKFILFSSMSFRILYRAILIVVE